MFRRIFIVCGFVYLLVAFGFTFLALLNASVMGDVVFVAETDAQVIVVLSVVGLAITALLGIRVMIDGRYRRDLERHVLQPRRKSDSAEMS